MKIIHVLPPGLNLQLGRDPVPGFLKKTCTFITYYTNYSGLLQCFITIKSLTKKNNSIESLGTDLGNPFHLVYFVLHMKMYMRHLLLKNVRATKIYLDSTEYKHVKALDISRLGLTAPESPYAVCSPIGQDQNVETPVALESPGAFASINNLRG